MTRSYVPEKNRTNFCVYDRFNGYATFAVFKYIWHAHDLQKELNDEAGTFRFATEPVSAIAP